MNRFISRWRVIAGSAVLALLTACGGGGGDSPESPTPTSGQKPPAGSTPLSGWKVEASVPTDPFASQRISLKASGVGTADRIVWDFGDGTSQTDYVGEGSVTHNYAKTGEFVVTATLTGRAGDQQVVTTKVTVLPNAGELQISQSVDPKIPLLPGARVRFAASGVVPYSSDPRYINPITAPAGMTYRWTFSDGATGDTAAMVRSFDTAGRYDVELTGTDRYGRKISAKRTLVVSSVAVPTMLQTNLAGPGSINYGPLSLLGGGRTAIVRDKAGNTFILDARNQVIRKVTPTGIWSDFVGASGIEGLVDGTGPEARLSSFSTPMAIAADDTIYFYDKGALRSVTPKGEVTTFDPLVLVGGDENAAKKLNLGATGMAVGPDGSIYITTSRQLMRVKEGRLSVVAGSDDGSPAWVDGTASSARFGELSGVTVRANGEVLVADRCFGVRRIGTDGQVSGVAQFQYFSGSPVTPAGGCANLADMAMTMAADGSVLVLGQGLLRVIDKDNAVRTVAINVYGSTIVSVDATTAWTTGDWRPTVDWIRLDYGTSNVQFGRSADTNEAVVPFANSRTGGVAPGFGIAMDENDNVVFASKGTIYRYYVSSHDSSAIVVSQPGVMADGPSGDAIISGASHIVTDAAGNIYFSDGNDSALRRRDASTGYIRTLAGSSSRGTADGIGGAAKFNQITRLVVTPGGTAFLIDDFSRLVRVSPTGEATTVLNFPDRASVELGMTPAGQLLIARANRIHRLEPDNSLTVLGGTTDQSAARESRLYWPAPNIVVSPDGKIYVLDEEYTSSENRRTLRRLESSGQFTDIAQDSPMAKNLFADRDALELPFSFRLATFRRDGKLMVFAGQPHSWWLLDGLR
ncbi:PKD domain-containing protein [Roseateles depolymerans]|uniref:Uncharacterized protein n=1 Tax=Roseateles depolymerans TaxID=76731 RepID=A0A0U3LEA4_9BURK|nr:PKD domain-containing protein [Roseateles depolymerans]ALV06447.1 hypothetical protein RD2015_1971 [Roseateles depolymerans]REG19421.1 PKD domain-containing protein [Roseateles depolymerans]